MSNREPCQDSRLKSALSSLFLHLQLRRLDCLVFDTAKLEDFDKADLIIVVGQNPGTNHPRMLTLRDAKKNGASIVSILVFVEPSRSSNPTEIRMSMSGCCIRTSAFTKGYERDDTIEA